MRKAFSVQSFWALKSPEKIFFGCIQLALAWWPPKEDGIRKEGEGKKGKKGGGKKEKRVVRCAAFLSLSAWEGRQKFATPFAERSRRGA